MRAGVSSELLPYSASWSGWLRNTCQAASPLMVIGDFNIAPGDRDVYDPDAWRGTNAGPPRARVSPATTSRSSSP